MNPVRVPLYGFPDVVLHADELSVKRHPQYQAAKKGDVDAADLLVAELASHERIGELRSLLKGHTVELVPIHALETEGVNEIPAALATLLSALLQIPLNLSIVQTNTVGHTGASGFQRLANQALFAGEVKPEQQYLIVDDFVGQGGTLANLIGFITSNGGRVAGATVLTGKPYSAKLAPDAALIQALREKHGRDLENWWGQTFGFGYDSLTRSEARYLENSPDAHAIRDRLIAGGLEGRGLLPEAAAEPLIESEPARHSDHPKPVPTPKPRS
jgi:adenine/guanine phosphoribosyltransferase-like PRPP-binding protein